MISFTTGGSILDFRSGWARNGGPVFTVYITISHHMTLIMKKSLDVFLLLIVTQSSNFIRSCYIRVRSNTNMYLEITVPETLKFSPLIKLDYNLRTVLHDVYSFGSREIRADTGL